MLSQPALALRQGAPGSKRAHDSHSASPEPEPAAGRRRFPRRSARAFTLTELLVVIALVALLAATLVPALAHTKLNSLTAQCLNNLRQMTRAWEMYAEDNSGKLVSAYPLYGTFTGNAYYGWCADNATGGSTGESLGGADPAGIQAGRLWPYARSLSLYHCPADHRVSPFSGPYYGKPMLRSISMNSFLCGTGFGIPSWTPTTAATATRDPNYPIYLKQSEMKLPKQTFVFVDEDQDSINDGMLYMDVGGSYRLIDLPSRAHRFGYGISFADGHAEIYQFKDDASKKWRVSDSRPMGGLNDWMKLRSVTTHPL